MTVAVPFIVAGIAGFGASKIVSKITGSQTLGMIAGIAAGGLAGSMASAGGAAAGGASGGGAGTGATTVAAGSSGAGVGGTMTNYMQMPTASPGSGLLSGATPAISQNATAAGVTSGAAGPVTAAAPGAAVPGAAGSSSWLSKVGLTPEMAWNMGGNIMSGYGDYKMRGNELDIYEERNDLARDKFNREEEQRQEQQAYGMTRSGDSVDLNMKDRLAGVNTAFSNLNNLTTANRPEGGYLSEYGRFSKPEEKKA